MSGDEAGRRELYQRFTRDHSWPPDVLARIPIPQLVRIWLWKDADIGPVVSKAEAIEFLRKRGK